MRVLRVLRGSGDRTTVLRRAGAGNVSPSQVLSLRAEALFVSNLQPSEAPAPTLVRAAVTASLSRYGPRGCAIRVAQAFGEHPIEAAARMSWALRLLRSAYPAGGRLSEQRPDSWRGRSRPQRRSL